MPYFFEEGYENHQDGDVNATKAMEWMEKMLDHFKEHTCVEFLRLRTKEEKNQYEYKIMIVFDGNKDEPHKPWSRLGETERNFFV